MILDISRRSTSLHGIANVHIQTTNVGALGDGALGEFALGEGPEIHRVLVKIDDSFFDVARCAAAVFKLWNDLFSENGW
jgi:hypothetical protein